MKPKIRRLIRAGFYLACAAIGVLSLMPGRDLPSLSIGDKAEHVIAYAVLGLLGIAGGKRGAVRLLLGLAAYGIILELLQSFSPGRSPDMLDGLADIAGTAAGAGIAAALRHARLVAIDKFGHRATPCGPSAADGDAPRAVASRMARSTSRPTQGDPCALN